MGKIAKWIRHNQGMTLSLLIVSGLMVWNYGCESKVASLRYPDVMVNMDELKLEIDAELARLNQLVENLLASGNLKMAQLEKIDKAKRALFDFAAITIDAKTVNPAGVVGLLFSVLGIGAVVDNRLKDKVIKNRPLPPAAE